MSSSILLVKRSIWGYFTRAFVITPCDLGQKLPVIEELRDTVSANLPIMSMAYASVQCFDKEVRKSQTENGFERANISVIWDYMLTHNWANLTLAAGLYC